MTTITNSYARYFKNPQLHGKFDNEEFYSMEGMTFGALETTLYAGIDLMSQNLRAFIIQGEERIDVTNLEFLEKITKKLNTNERLL